MEIRKNVFWTPVKQYSYQTNNTFLRIRQRWQVDTSFLAINKLCAELDIITTLVSEAFQLHTLYNIVHILKVQSNEYSQTNPLTLCAFMSTDHCFFVAKTLKAFSLQLPPHLLRSCASVISDTSVSSYKNVSHFTSIIYLSLLTFWSESIH